MDIVIINSALDSKEGTFVTNTIASPSSVSIMGITSLDIFLTYES